MRYRILAFLAFAALCYTSVYASSGTTIVMPNQMRWQAQPDGSSMAVLYGDPSKPGLWIVRLKAPPHWTFGAHYHPNRENVSVLSGVFYAGMGKKFDAKRVSAFPAGSFVSLPANTPHYALTKDQPALLEITGTEPTKDVMVK